MFPVLLGARGPVEVELIRGIERLGQFTITRRCSDGPELLAAARTGAGRIVVVTADFCPIDLDYLTGLTTTGTEVVLLIDDPVPGALARVASDMGVRVGARPSEVLEHLEDWLRRQHELQAQPLTDGILDGETPASGHVTAVWGPGGAPGRTRLAIEVAHQHAARGSRTLLVDADPYGGTIAAALGLLDESSGLIAAIREAGRGELTGPGLLRLAVALQPGLRLLAGIPRADRWPELTPATLERVWQTARTCADAIVIDCGSLLETDEELMFDTQAPQRNGATLSALSAADAVIAVGQADPVQMPRLVRGLAQLREHIVPTSQVLRVAVTRVRSSVAGRGAKASAREILDRYAAISDSHIIPEDQENFDAALLAGKSVLETAPKSEAVAAIYELVDSIPG